MRSTITQEQRAIGKRNTNFTMLQYQEMPMIREGWKPKTEINIQVFSKTYTPPSTGSQIRDQRRRDQMAANNRRTELNRLARLDKLFAAKKEITGKDAMLILELADHRRGNEALQRFAKDGYVALSRVESQTNFYTRCKK